ncbi:unnamed protein product [Pieris brassicae]|uniref:Integrase catalytic domain-containing protein n=1 Tax=Pieris brassicae TaxID=7116 RepID=A0A9P0TQ26_PIEBR|nr:unnamed protein product [Pieris brassicae]
MHGPYVHIFGTPKRIISDQVTSFTGSNFQNLCNEWSIEFHEVASGVSRGNGRVERVVSVLTEFFTIAENQEEGSWKSVVGGVQLALNCTVCKGTGGSPFQLLFGINKDPPWLNFLIVDAKGHFTSTMVSSSIKPSGDAPKNGKSPSDLVILAGTNSITKRGTTYKIDKIIKHENNTLNPVKNDIGLMRTAKKIKFTDKVKAIELAEDPKPGQTCKLAGWGFTSVSIRGSNRVPRRVWLAVLCHGTKLLVSQRSEILLEIKPVGDVKVSMETITAESLLR